MNNEPNHFSPLPRLFQFGTEPRYVENCDFCVLLYMHTYEWTSSQ